MIEMEKRSKIGLILLITASIFLFTSSIVIYLHPSIFFEDESMETYVSNMVEMYRLEGTPLFERFFVNNSASGDMALVNAQNYIQNNITYTSDTLESWRTPSQTIQDKVGDCEDMAFLFVSLAISYGYDEDSICVCFGKIIDADGEEGGHAWVVIEQEGIEYVIEPTLRVYPMNIVTFQSRVMSNYMDNPSYAEVYRLYPNYMVYG